MYKKDQCSAIICHGPGHQSKTHCCKIGPHQYHETYYGSYDQFARWLGEKVFSGFFDDPPIEPEGNE